MKTKHKKLKSKHIQKHHKDSVDEKLLKAIKEGEKDFDEGTFDELKKDLSA